jgi:hypothetical protein
VTVTLSACTLQYESTIVSSESQLASLTSAERQYIVDVPIQRMSLCGQGKFDEQIFALPKNTKVIFLTFLHEDQFILNAGLHKWLSPRFKFAPNLEHIQVSLPGREGLIAVQGLYNLGVAGCSTSPTLKAYHRHLVKSGIYENEYSSFCPSRFAQNKGYEQALVISLKDFEIEEGVQLKITCKYSDALAAIRWHMHLFCIVQRQLECSSSKQWTWKDL